MKRLTGLLLVLLLVFSLSAALAQRVECPVGGFSVTLPDHFVEVPVSPGSDLCFYWHGNKLTVQSYAIYQGEVTETFEVLTGNETDSGTDLRSGKQMDYVAGTATEGDYRIYTWLDQRNQVQLYFLVSGRSDAASPVIDAIMDSIAFD